ncbi:MAG: PD40 domain-containing protein [Gemmatimonadetes bacterium]|nr:PD40 domain-containing protein [Gemmatimonadota bacterium]
MRRLAVTSAALACCASLLTAQRAATDGVQGFYRFPALHGDLIVFAAEGDLWAVATSGGVARRLTTHPGEETNPVISPDGTTLAFTARYEGPAEVYTMPIGGGVPVRRTWEAEPSLATAWTPDGKLVYGTTRYAGVPKRQLVEVNLADNTRALVPLVGASEANYDPTGKVVYFARPGFHGNVTKQYTGGTARDIWKYVSGAAEAVELTGDYKGESHSPMVWQGRVYFVSDRDGSMNLWSMTTEGTDVRQHTRHRGWDVRSPSMWQGRIVYQFGADLWIWEVTADAPRLVPITLASDLDQLREKWVTDPIASLTGWHLSPDGDRVVLTSRGRVFVAPARQGRLVRASRQDGTRYRDVTFMPDGRQLLGLSDASGEFEFVKLPANGVGRDSAITRNGSILRFDGKASPDGRRIAYRDLNEDLWIVNAATGQQHKVSTNREGVADLAWSPDGRWLAYVSTSTNTFQQVKLHDADSGRTVTVTSDRVNSTDPAWDPKGEFLYFLSDRNLRTLVGGPWGTRQPEPFFDKPIEIYAVSLRAGLRSPFAPNDELAPRTPAARGTDTTGATTAPAATAGPVRAIRIDVAGIELRVRRVPVPAGNYNALVANAEGLFWLATATGPDAPTDLRGLRYGNEKVEAVVVADSVRSLELSRNGRKLLVRRANALYVLDARPVRQATNADTRVDLGGWSYPIDVRADWRQIFTDAWRMERDYFYDAGLHGVDWAAALRKYLPLVDRVTTRDELSDLIGWVVGDLSALHTSVGGGDLRRGRDSVVIATLGARLFRDAARGGYRIDQIYRHDPDYPDTRSPLADPDLGISAGDVITAVNGVNLLEVDDIGVPLRNQAGRQVLVTVRSGTNTRDVVVTAMANEATLRYTDWEVSRRLAVDSAGGGRLGYVHLRAMGGADVNQWYREFYPVFDRQGLIIDVRQNRGGNIDSFILEKLMRKAWMYFKGRSGVATWNMQYAFRGHMVVLVDQETASDGEAFADGFRRLGLGAVIGARTWGGEIWLSNVNQLSDGGVARAPMTGVYGPERKWLIEQEGVVPDIEVDNLPHQSFLGRDAQLEAAVAYLKKKIADDPRAVPAPPAYPRRGIPATPPSPR